jgi:L-arabinose isomerase
MDSTKPKIGLLCLMTELYRQLPAIAERLNPWIRQVTSSFETFADVHSTEILDLTVHIEKAVSDLENVGCDLLVVFPVAFAPSMISLPALLKTRLPILVLNTQMYVGWNDDADSLCFSDNQAPTGVFDLTNSLVRTGVPFEIVSGHWQDSALLREVEEWAIAACAVKKIRGSRIGLAGYPMEDTGDFTVDRTVLLKQLGILVKHIDLSEIINLTEQAPADTIKSTLAWNSKHMDVDPDVSGDSHEYAARQEYAVRQVIERYGLKAFSYHFDTLANDGRFEGLPMLVVCKLLSEGIGFGGEGDVNSAAAYILLKELAGSADFFETWGMDFQKGGVLKNHMGEGNIDFARSDIPVRLVEAPFGLGGDIKSNVIPVFTMRKGEGTLLNLTTGPSGGIRTLTVEGQIPDFKPIKGVNSPHGKFLPDAGFPGFLNDFAQAGGTHHSVFCYGRMAKRISKAAKLLGIEHIAL